MVLAFFVMVLFPAVSHGLPATPQKSFEEVAKRAEAARAADRIDDAIDSYGEGVRLRPSWSEGWWWLGSLLYDQDRFPEAQLAFKRFISIARDAGPAYAFLALCEYEARDSDRALRHFQEWARRGWPGNDALIDVASFHWALLLTREGHFSRALYLLVAKAQKLGASPSLVEALGLASMRMANLPEDYPPERRELVWLAGMAQLYSSLDDAKRSEQYADRLVLRYGREPNVHYFRGTLYGIQKLLDAAAEEYQKELRISPQNAAAMLELALVQIEDFQPNEAVPLAKRAVDLDPENPRARYALGRALFDAGRPQEGVPELEIAERLAPSYGPIRYTLAKAYTRLGRTQEAKRETAAFLSLKEKAGSFIPPAENRIK